MIKKLKEYLYIICPVFIIRAWDKVDSLFKFYTQKLFTRDHIAYVEVWGLEFYLATWLLPRIHHLKHHKVAYPVQLTPESWKYILGEIEFACVYNIYSDWAERTKLEKQLVKELILEPYGDVREYIFGDLNFVDRDDGMVEIKGDKLILDKGKKEIYYTLEERMRKGFKLIGEYYLNLWD